MDHDINEQRIIEACRRGDLSNFGMLYDAYVKKIYSFIFFRTHHKETAEDLTSRVWLKALRHIRTFHPQAGSFSSWVYQIARRTVIDFYRTKKDEAELRAAEGFPTPISTEKAIDIHAALADIERQLETLNPQQGEILILRLWDELSYKEISEVTGKTETACRMEFSRALRELRQRLPLAAWLFIYLSAHYG